MVPYWLAETDRALAFLDINPIRPAHSLVIPKAHTLDLQSVSPEDWAAVTELTSVVQRRLRRALRTSGENVFVASGPGSEQSVFHLHVHIIPRNAGDDLQWNDWWQTKVRPAATPDLVELARRIRG